MTVLSFFLFLFIFFGYRSQWIDSEVHQAADRENPHKKTGKTSLNGLLVLTQSCMSLRFWLVHVRDGTNTSPEWWKWLIAAAVVQLFRTNISWCHASGLQVIWRISLVSLIVFLVSSCQQIPRKDQNQHCESCSAAFIYLSCLWPLSPKPVFFYWACKSLKENISFWIMLMVQCLVIGWVSLFRPLRPPITCFCTM